MTTLNMVDIDKGIVEVELFSQTDAGLAALREKYDVIPDATTDAGYEFVKEGCKELTGLRTSIEAKRKEIKEPYLQAGRIIDAEAKRITEEIVKLEDPLKKVKKEIDDKEKRMKEERIARLNLKIQAIRDHVAMARGKSSADIAEMIDYVSSIDATQDYYELTNEAVNARAETLESLGELYNDRLSFEESERLRIEEQKKRQELEAEQAIDKRITNLQMMPMEYLQKSADDTRAQISRLANFEPSEKDFGKRCDEVKLIMANVVSQLTAMVEQKTAMEALAKQNAEVEKAKQTESSSGDFGAPAKKSEVSDKTQAQSKQSAAEIEVPKIAALEQTQPEEVEMVTMLVTCPASEADRIKSMIGTVKDATVSDIE